MTGNPLIVCNPEPLQMNTAFSRAYILDEAGSKAGLKGPNVFVDQSFLDIVDTVCRSASSHYRAIKKVNKSGFLYFVKHVKPHKDRPWCFGMLLDNLPGSVKLKSLSTKVFRLKKFFPDDENPREFSFDLETD